MTNKSPLILGIAMVFAQSALAIPVYRSIDSPLPSGDYSIKKLTKNQKRIVSQTWYQIQRGSSQGWVQLADCYSAWDLVRKAVTTEETPLRHQPRWDDPVVTSIPAAVEVELIAIQDHWAMFSMDGTNYWVNTLQLEPLQSDLGFAIARVASPVYQDATSKVEVSRLKPGDKVVIDKFEQGRLKISMGRLNGYVNPVNYISLLSHVLEFKDLDGKWHRIQKRSLPKLLTTQKSFISIDQITAMKISRKILWTRNPQTQIFRKAQKMDAPLTTYGTWQKLVIKKAQTQRWALSHVDRLDVWWQYQQPEKSLKEELLNTQQIFARKVFAMETSPARPNLMFASAGGVFKSTDGQSWKRLDTFEQKNYPIAISPAGTILIGPFRSDDHGVSFQEYVPWHKLAKTISNKAKTHFLEIRKLKFNSPDGKSYTLSIDTGTTVVDISTGDNGKTWKLN